jgi:hypothetical protein
MSTPSLRLSALAILCLAGTGLAFAQQQGDPSQLGTAPSHPLSGATTGVAPADRPSNNDQPSLAGEVVPSPQDAAAHNDAVWQRDQLPTLAHTFNFTDEQKQQIRDALSAEQGQAGNDKIEAGMQLSETDGLKPVPNDLARQMPWVKPYRYAKRGDRIVLVDPNLPVVVAVIE